MSRKRPKSLDAPVVIQVIQLEAWAYLRCDQWKKSYRYTLVNEFRTHITNTKNTIIRAFELSNKLKEEKSYLYSVALGELSIVESNMDIMIMNEINVMSEKEWAEVAKRIDDIRMALSRIQNSLNKGVGGSECLNFGTDSVSANYKDV